MIAEATGLVLTFNGADHLARTLESLSFCSRLMVVDSGSTDGTLEIANNAGANVLHRDWEGTIPQFRFAFERIETPWVVTLDQDEWFSEPLRDELVRRLAEPSDAGGFWMRRSSYFFDRYMRHGGWYPDWLLRAFRLDSMELRGVLPHEEFHPIGRTERIETSGADIIHHPYRDLSEHLGKLASYTRTSAEQLHARGASGGVTKATARAAGRFVKKYLLKKGFLDGRAGFALAVYDMVNVFHKYMLVEEMRLREKGGPDRG
ncbi:glycosyltransferase family 2 protein [Desulfohalovibrio reitneri]|uniref:glycosyltransferase family 2 protein n=1 Tax=Desulfohalovibrio reitneri TaxID=1307759 RepID=UPI0004A73E96|nr:glycosyltransferase family 2 protein [Desulfohalovibrio reitneri]